MEKPLFQAFLKTFYQSKVGQPLSLVEAEMIQGALKNVFGYFLLQVGCTSDQNWLSSSRVSYKTLVDNCLSCEEAKQYQSTIVADLDYLPIKKDSIDVVFLPHTIEAVADPYHLLRQVDDLLIPEGRLILTGFNPYGCGILKLKMGQHRAGFQKANMVKISRLVDWLKLLGYDIEQLEISPTVCFLSQNYQAWSVLSKLGKMLSWLGLETGNVYCISAIKRVSSPTPLGLNWKLSNLLPLKKKTTVLASNRQNRLQRSPNVTYEKK